MSILYDFYVSPSGGGTEVNGESCEPAPVKVHARVVNRQTLDPETLVNHICERSTLGKGDVVAMFSELNHEVAQQLLAGNSVNIPGLGYFSLSLLTPANANPRATRAQHLRVKRIEFRADPQLRKKVLNEASFERSPEKRHSAEVSNEEVELAVRGYLKGHPFITRKVFSELCHLTKGTALNHIRRLVKEGVLVNSNTPHNPIYMLK